VSIQINFNEIFARIYNLFRGYLLKFNIGHLILIAFALHIFVISFPNDGGKIFDEAHYIPSALTHLNWVGSNAEHTPLVKIIGAIAIAIFGDYWFAWRFPIVLMGTASIWVMYKLASRFFSKKYALFAASFLLFDIMFFIHGTIFVLDVPQILFSLCSFDLYFQKKYKWSALAMGISVLMKETGLLFLGGLAFYHLVTHLRRQHVSKLSFRTFGVFSLVLLLVVGGGMWTYDGIFKPVKGIIILTNEHHIIITDPNGTVISTSTTIDNITSSSVITNPIEHLIFAYQYQTGLGINEPWRAYQFPWNWILPVDPLDHPIYLMVTVTAGSVSRTIIAWHAQGTIPIWYAFWLVVPMAILTVAKSFSSPFTVEISVSKPGKRKHRGKQAEPEAEEVKKEGILETFHHRLDLFLLSWVGFTYLPWVALGLAMRKIGFNYYMIYTVPALCLGIPFFWQKLNISDRAKTIGITVHLLVTILFFLYFFPVPLFRA